MMEPSKIDHNVGIVAIEQLDPRTLGIKWSDDRESKLDVVALRRKCPCAACIDEWSRKPLLKDQDVPEDVRPTVIESVGRYGVSIHFTDGHKTGIYTYKMLRELN